MRTVNQYFSLGGIPLARGMEPETLRAISNFKKRPKIVDQLNINEWIKDLKDAASLTHGVDNLGTKFDVVYNFAVNTIYNSRIDFVTGDLKAEFINITSGQFTPWVGFEANTGSSLAVNTKWNINASGNVGTPNNNHVHSSQLADLVASTSSYMGINQYALTIRQTVSTDDFMRFTSGTNNAQSSINTQTKGGYTIKRTSSTAVSSQKNEETVNNFTRSYTSYFSYEYHVLGINQDGSSTGGTRQGNIAATFTAGSSDVDGALLSLADKTYLANYGITLY